MTFPQGSWRPTPELLAAYFDGEYEGRDDLVHLKRRIEDWLAVHPEECEELCDFRRLKHLWQQTTPADPQPEQWSAMFTRLKPLVDTRTVSSPRRRRSWLLGTGLTASAAVLAFVAVYLSMPAPPAQEAAKAVKATAIPAPKAIDDEFEFLPVADAREVTIVRVEGDDTQTLVVGALPLQGNLELVAAGDVIVTQIRSDAKTKATHPVLIGSTSPMIWAKMDTEE